MASREDSIDFSTPTPGESSASFGVSRSTGASTSLALDRLELRLDLKEMPTGPVELVLHTTAGDAAGLGLAVAVNGRDVDRCAVQSEHRLVIPQRHLEVGQNIIRLAKLPLFVTRISAVIADPATSDEPASSAVEPVPFGIREPTST